MKENESTANLIYAPVYGTLKNNADENLYEISLFSNWYRPFSFLYAPFDSEVVKVDQSVRKILGPIKWWQTSIVLSLGDQVINLIISPYLPGFLLKSILQPGDKVKLGAKLGHFLGPAIIAIRFSKRAKICKTNIGQRVRGPEAILVEIDSSRKEL
jgi:hypothetical protein